MKSIGRLFEVPCRKLDSGWTGNMVTITSSTYMGRVNNIVKYQVTQLSKIIMSDIV